MKAPLDPTPYPRDPRSQPIQVGLPDGGYAYVQGVDGTIYVVPDGPHVHPQILGGGSPANYAGDLTIDRGRIVDVTNLSGTFQCDDPDGLLEVAAALRSVGFAVDSGAVRFFPQDGSRPRVIQ
jgi:hypothetical protein